MRTLIFGDKTSINWTGLGVRMPFAPMHELAEKYELTNGDEKYFPLPLRCIMPLQNHIARTFELKYKLTKEQIWELADRIEHRTVNTMAALDACSSDTICINLGGGMHHSGKYPNTGYAYSLINDIIWAVDYQLDKNPDIRIGIWDIDFHYAGGTIEYYRNNPRVDVFSECAPLRGVLYQHQHLRQEGLGCCMLDSNTVDKVLLNLGTDYSTEDELFGQYAWYDRAWVMALWKNTITYILEYKKPLAITFGGSYGDAGLSMYEELISWLQAL
jgi:hypothetical protein